jgi:predicted O-linked N-acetylglucosamine transferase (SPINDLY family)
MSENEAKNFFEKALEYYKEKKFDLVEKNFEAALNLSPNRISILENLASVYFLNKKYKKSEIVLNQLKELKVDNDKLSEIKFYVLKKLSKEHELHKFLKEKNYFKDINKKIYVNAKLLYPSFFNSMQAIDDARLNLINNLDELKRSKDVSLSLDGEKIEPPIFNISYDQYENLDINKKIVQVFRKIYPELNQNFKIKEFNSKIKIGFISEFFSNHTIGKLFKGIILNLNKKKFQVVVFHSRNTDQSPIFQEFLSAEKDLKIKNIFLHKGFQKNVDEISKENLDIVFFPDIGMSSEFYYLSFIRFAKIQITSWGHPITTSNASIDYFLSSKLLETRNAQERFSEKLILSDYLPMYFYKPKIKNILLDSEIVKKNHYFCSQNLMKIHPHFDEIIGKILKKDKKSKIFFIKDKNEIISNKLLKRFKSNNLIDRDRVSFIEKMGVEDYINLCGSSSVLLDTLYFGAGNSFHESMFYGTPTVTMPTDNMKSRIVVGAYKQMQVENPPVVNSIDEYIDRAVETANLEAKKMLDLKKYFQKEADKHLFENKEFLKDINLILENLHKN